MFNFSKVTQIFRIPELRKKILIVFGLLVVFRIAAVIPVPGIPTDLASLRTPRAATKVF